MKDKKVGSFQTVGSVLFDALRTRGVAEGVERASVFPEWEELVGELCNLSTCLRSASAPASHDDEPLGPG